MSKVVVLFILAFATTAIFCAEKNIPAAYKVIGKSIRASCLAETGANEDVVNAANDGVFPNDKPLWCYLKCLFQRMGTVKGENIDFKKLMTVFPGKISDTYVPGFKYCKDNAPVGADGCETLFLFNKCLFEHNPECADTNVPAVFKDIAKSLRATCLAETGANEDVVNAVFKGEFGNDKQVWCYFKCILEKMGKMISEVLMRPASNIAKMAQLELISVRQFSCLINACTSIIQRYFSSFKSPFLYTS
ncbi:PREDICTED: uncharacterized protein LOC108567397 isoform X2 [Nicrophorus vespilloides]|uniref:Uncharacterized protein LOC108567397 isoform X2 n=1 Tax=Nicrophorus vespilloides TaxID=110193 RepID=A0ABM1N917_NICVS|nr:PREDICTED: uncharacterized protein LOC108567397 isoform X2 [Nicrophorus vespilloides]